MERRRRDKRDGMVVGHINDTTDILGLPRPMDGNCSNPGAQGAPSALIEGKGGNVGLLSGSVLWRNIRTMGVYRGSQPYANDACWAMW